MPTKKRSPGALLHPTNWTESDFIQLALDQVEATIEFTRKEDYPGALYEYATALAAQAALIDHLEHQGVSFYEAFLAEHKERVANLWKAHTEATILADYETYTAISG